MPLRASDPLPLQAELDVAAKTPPRQMPLFGPVHGPPLPQVDHESSLQAKVGLYRALLAGRSDVYAYRWENPAEGTKGWAPKRRPGTTRDNPEYLPLTDEVISAHLTKETRSPAGSGRPGRCLVFAPETRQQAPLPTGTTPAGMPPSPSPPSGKKTLRWCRKTCHAGHRAAERGVRRYSRCR